MEDSMEFKASTASELFTVCSNAIYRSGNESRPRGQKILELNNVQLVLTNPFNNLVKIKERKLSLKYVIAEWLWYCTARQDKTGSDYIARFAPFWNTIRNEDGSLNSNYGFYFFSPMNAVFPINNSKWNYSHKSQFDHITDLLQDDPDSRQAIVNINNMSHKNGATKDFPCTLGIQYFIRNGKLESTVIMRSTDLILGFCNDIFQFAMFQIVLYNRLKHYYPELKMGSLTLFTGSLHVYERHWDMISKIIKSGGNNRVEFPYIPFFDLEYEDFYSMLTRRMNSNKSKKAYDFVMEILGE